MTPFGPANTGPVQSKRSGIVESAFRCDECNRLNLGTTTVEKLPTRQSAGIIDASENRAFWNDEHEIIWHPASVIGQNFDDVPENISHAADEAHVCLNVGALMSAVLMARSVIEGTAKSKGIDKGSLQSKIDELAKNGHIRPFIKESAHEIRHIGNDMAHGDFEQVSSSEAQDVLTLMAEVLNEVFQSPARMERLRERRTAGDSGH